MGMGEERRGVRKWQLVGMGRNMGHSIIQSAICPKTWSIRMNKGLLKGTLSHYKPVHPGTKKKQNSLSDCLLEVRNLECSLLRGFDGDFNVRFSQLGVPWCMPR